METRPIRNDFFWDGRPYWHELRLVTYMTECNWFGLWFNRVFWEINLSIMCHAKAAWIPIRDWNGFNIRGRNGSVGPGFSLV